MAPTPGDLAGNSGGNQNPQPGRLLACSAKIKLSDEVMVWRMETMRYAEARVVFRAVSVANDRVELALEFIGSDDFWGLDFSCGMIAQRCHSGHAVLLL